MKWVVPREIPIGGSNFSVKYEKDIRRNSNAIGQCRVERQQIAIDPDSTNATKEIVLVHEIIHAIADRFCGGEVTEEMVRNLEVGFTVLLKDLGVKFDWRDIECVS